MSIIAEKCREKRHHPEWANVSNVFLVFLLGGILSSSTYLSLNMDKTLISLEGSFFKAKIK